MWRGSGWFSHIVLKRFVTREERKQIFREGNVLL
jgi:hypothetical protein